MSAKNKSGPAVQAAVEGPSGRARLVDQELEPCAVIIFGASGDLTARKLIPALLELMHNGGLPEPYFVLGCGRSEMSDKAFRAHLADRIKQTEGELPAGWPKLAPRLHYKTIAYDKAVTYKELGQALARLEKKYKTRGNRIFYFALPPTLYQPVAGRVAAGGLSKPAGGFSRLVIEKPFGSDLETARALNQSLHRAFGEERVFRMDHYLAKETVQNLLMFRFANAIFEPLWNRRYIDYVVINAAETLGVEHRAGYYEQAGVIRDMFQNHIMQLLALCAMEPPSHFSAERVQDEKVKVFGSLRPFPLDKLDDYLVLGQYGAGMVEGKEVAAYRNEPGVAADSITPTFAALKVFVDNWRWQGVPFILVSGKRLKQKLTDIVIQYKEVPHSLFRLVLGEHISANRLTLGIQPQEIITLQFQSKVPGARVELRSMTMHFDYHQGYQGPTLDPYARALLDCMLGDHMLFWRRDGVEQSWAFLTPIIERCETCDQRFQRLKFYEPGSWGPQEAERLLPPGERRAN